MIRLRPLTLCVAALLLLTGCETTTVTDLGDGPTGYIPGHLYLETQADVDAVAGIVEVEGNLYIGRGPSDDIIIFKDSDIVDLGPLASLRYVGNVLRIMDVPLLESVDGLESLGEVGNHLLIDADLPAAALAPLAGVRCERLTIASSEIADLAEMPDMRSEILLLTCPRLKNLVGIEFAAGVGNLYVACDSIVDFGELAKLPLLNELQIRSCRMPLDLATLGELPGLEFLNIRNCPGLTSLEGLGGLTGTERLAVDGCDALEDLEGVDELPALVNLKIAGCEGLVDLTGVAGLPAVEELSVSWCPGLTDLFGLRDLPTLAKVSISSCEMLASLAGLDILDELVFLDISDCDALVDLSGLGAGIAITRLHVERCDQLLSLDGVGDATYLLDLTISNCSVFTDLGALANLPGLYNIVVSMCPLLEDLSPLADSPGLRDVELRNLPLVTDLQLDGLSTLLGFEISGLGGLTEMRGVPPLESLDWLHINQCAELTSLAGLEHLASVPGSIRIWRNDKLNDISALAALEYVGRWVQVSDNPLLDNCVALEFFESITVEEGISVHNNGPCR